MINLLERFNGYQIDVYGMNVTTSEGYALHARECLKMADLTSNKYRRWAYQMLAAKWYQMAAEARRNGR